MKMKLKHFNHIKTELESLLNKYPRLIEEYEAGLFPRSEKVKDLNVRFRSDLMYGAGLSKWVSDNLYSYLNDKHIDTALRTIVPKVNRNY